MSLQNLAIPPRDGFRLEGKHRDGCRSVARAQTFIVPDGMRFDLKRNGHRGGSTGWLRFKCNDVDRPARALVRWDVVADLIDSGMKGAA